MNEKIRHPPYGGAPTALGAGKILLSPMRIDVDLRTRLLQGDAGREPGKHIQIAILAAGGCSVRRSQRQWRPELGRESKQAEFRRHHTGHHVVLTVQSHRSSHDRRIRTETALPQAMAEDEHMVMPWLIFAHDERPAKLRRDAKG